VAEGLEWQRWLLAESGREGWLRGGSVVALIGVVAVILSFSLPPFGAGLLVFLLIFTCLPFFLPRRYRISQQSVIIIRSFLTDRREWREFRGFEAYAKGVLLLAAEGKPARFNLFLPYPLEAVHKDRLLEFLAQVLPEAQTSVVQNS
jgi:hypothetical protein